MAEGQTMMQVEQAKRGKFTKAASVIASIPILGVGMGLLYIAFDEQALVFLFLYVALGLVVTLFGFVLLLQGVPSGGGKKYVKGSDIAKQMEKDGPPPTPEGVCPHCNADVVSAGKFCGACGKSL